MSTGNKLQSIKLSLIYCIIEHSYGLDVEIFNHLPEFHDAWDTRKWIDGIDHPSIRKFLNEEKTKRNFSSIDGAKLYLLELEKEYQILEINEIE